MFVGEFLVAFLFTLFFLILLVGAFGWGRESRGLAWGPVLFAFFLLLLAIWAGGVWVAPAGPALYGVAWVPFLFIGLFVFLFLLAAAAPARRWRTRRAGTTMETEYEDSAAALGVFFWLLLGLLVIALIVGYA